MTKLQKRHPYNVCGLSNRWGSMVAGDLEDFSVRAQRTRRNIVKMGSILAPAVLASAVLSRAKRARAATPAVAVARISCFLKGTKIWTAEGDRNVEDLAIGDMLPTMFGGLRPVQWIGRYPIKKSDPSKPWVREALPVRIACSALAPKVPQADLYVTAARVIDRSRPSAGGDADQRHDHQAL